MRRHCRARHTRRLAERGEINHAVTGTRTFGETAAAAIQHAKAVGVVEIQPGVMSFGQIEQRIDRRNVAVHAEHQIRDDELVLRVLFDNWASSCARSPWR